MQNKEFFIVVNKSDDKEEKEIEEILDNTESTLSDYSFNIKDISAYSSKEGRELSYRKKSLSNFLDSLDSRRHQQQKDKILAQLDNVYNECKKVRGSNGKKAGELENYRTYRARSTVAICR